MLANPVAWKLNNATSAAFHLAKIVHRILLARRFRRAAAHGREPTTRSRYRRRIVNRI